MKVIHSILLVAAYGLLCSASQISSTLSAAPSTVTETNSLCPLIDEDHPERLHGEYAVVFQPGYTLEEHQVTIGVNVSQTPRFLHALSRTKYVAIVDDATLLAIRKDPGVLEVRCSKTIDFGPLPFGNNSGPDMPPVAEYKRRLDKRYKRATRFDGTYGARLISAESTLSTPITDKGQYAYLWDGGANVDVYVFDTGVYIEHNYFDGKAKHFKGKKTGDSNDYTSGYVNDYSGHGTHVAGIIGSLGFGVIQQANIISVKIVGNGQSSVRTAQAIEDATTEFNNKKSNAKSTGFRGAVMSFSGGSTSDDAGIAASISDAIKAGITVVAAAGNSNVDLKCNPRYPCNYAHVICIGAINNKYSRWGPAIGTAGTGSNYGDRVDYWAPGQDVLSLSNTNPRGTVYMSGTSQAAPHVAAIAAIFTGWLKLMDGTCAGYIYSNSIRHRCGNLPFDIWGQLLANTGINNPSKYESEPFAYAKSNPRTLDNVSSYVGFNATYEKDAPPDYVPNFGTYEQPSYGAEAIYAADTNTYVTSASSAIDAYPTYGG